MTPFERARIAHGKELLCLFEYRRAYHNTSSFATQPLFLILAGITEIASSMVRLQNFLQQNPDTSLARAGRILTEKSAHLQMQLDAQRTPGQIPERAGVVAMHPHARLCTQRTARC